LIFFPALEDEGNATRGLEVGDAALVDVFLALDRCFSGNLTLESPGPLL
jgi:hypothetical protein